MKVFFAYGHKIFLVGLIKTLSYEHKMEIVGSATSIKKLRSSLSEVQADVLVLDCEMDENGGLSLIQEIKSIYPKLKVIAIGSSIEGEFVNNLLEMQVDGYIVKKNVHHELLKSVKAINSNKIFLSADINSLEIK